MLPLYLTIWLALGLFVAGESGRSRGDRRTPPRWAWWAFAAGAGLAIVHTLLAFHVVHDWVHEDAVRNTALQTQAMFGIDAGWGVYVNYLFLAVWVTDAWWWRRVDGTRYPAPVTWTLRAFYALIIVNAAVVFASGPRRLIGLALVGWLAVLWLQELTAAPASPRR
jgi:hypothetical protein